MIREKLMYPPINDGFFDISTVPIFVLYKRFYMHDSLQTICSIYLPLNSN